MKKLRRKLKELTRRKMPGTVTGRIAKINQVTRGWINYYALGSMKTAMTELDSSKDKTQNHYIETVESTEKATMGITETQSR